MSKRARTEEEQGGGGGGGGGGVNPQDSASGNDQRQGLISVNNLNYILEPDLSIAVNTTYKTQYFDQQTYKAGDNALCALNTGADYIDARRSYLHFTTTAVGALTVDNVEGNGLSFINHLVISSRSGDEICRIRDLNRWAAACHRYMKSPDWFSSVGSLYKFDGAAIADGATSDFVIPLYMLCDFFGYGRLLPSMLMSGLRIEIQWEDGSVIDITKGAKAAPSYTVSNCFFNLKCVQLTDATQRALNELSAVNGLEIVYCDWETTNQITNSNKIYCEVRRACSRALKAFCRLRVHGQRSTTDGEDAWAQANSFQAVDFCLDEYQWQLGSLYFPQQPIKAPRRANLAETNASGYKQPYYMTLEAFDKVDPDAKECCAVTPAEFKGVRATLGVNLERSSLFSLSGIPINNSRILSFHGHCQFDAAASGADGSDEAKSQYGFPRGEVCIYLKYVKLARVFLNNVEVEQ